MVYIYKKKVGEKTYYYLRASERKEDKVAVKDIAYLGDSLEGVKKALDNLPNYANQIRKAYKTIHNFLESNRYIKRIKELKIKKDVFLGEKTLEIEACKLHYNSEFKKQQQLTKEEILKNFIVEFAYNTTAIEGNTIKLAEARNLLEEGLTPKNKSLREIYDLQNTEKAFRFIFDAKEEITHEFIVEIHRKLMENIDMRAGYRAVDVRVIKANFKATPAPYVKTDMNLLVKWYDKHKQELHPLILASIFHHKFEKIHPFMDGNGRTGRMIMNYIMLKHGYPPFVVRTKFRDDYIRVLRQADKSDLNKFNRDDYERLILFLADQMIQSYWSIFL
ncbi:MAG: Fic family protein [Candidatus Pacearchaeota archaeon]|nr:Fic family protein [Candidatus Pacearchaeota archaeon]